MTAIERAFEAAGGITALASAIGVAQSAPSMWRTRDSVPPLHCAAIESATGGSVTRRDLRPDDWWRIWPELITAEHPAPEAKAA